MNHTTFIDILNFASFVLRFLAICLNETRRQYQCITHFVHKLKDIRSSLILTTNWKSYDNNQTPKYVLRKKVFKERSL